MVKGAGPPADLADFRATLEDGWPFVTIRITAWALVLVIIWR
jgi:hypothetical protein